MATWTGISESATPTWTGVSESATPTWTGINEGLAIAIGGDAMGVLGLTYSGGQEITGVSIWAHRSEEA